MSEEKLSLDRILVALDASPASLAALETAARLAAGFGAELLGLFVEDESLIRGAELPLTSVVGSFSGVVRRIERRDVEQQLRAQAEKARSAMAAIAERSRIRWSFRVTRGSVAAALGEAACEADMLSLGRGRAPLGRRMGQTTTSILEAQGVPVLLLDHGLRPGQTVVTIYDGGPGSLSALRLSRILARGFQTRQDSPVSVVLRGPDSRLDSLESSSRSELQRIGAGDRVRFYRLGQRDPALLTHLIGRGGIGVLVLPRPGALGTSVADLLSMLHCPVLVIRQPTP